MPIHSGPRIEREKITIKQMIHIYCRGNHQTSGKLCPACEGLLTYAHKRLSYCQFGENKTTCGKCTVHCYKPDMRSNIRQVMRYAGPRMIVNHPAEFLRHMFYSFKKPSQ